MVMFSSLPALTSLANLLGDHLRSCLFRADKFYCMELINQREHRLVWNRDFFGFSTVLKDCHATYVQLQPDIDVILKKIILRSVLDCVFMMDSKCFTSPYLSIPTSLLLMVIKKIKREIKKSTR